MARKITTTKNEAPAVEPQQDAPLPAASPTARALAPLQAAGFVMVGDTQIAIKRRVTIPTLSIDVDSDDAVAAGRDKMTVFGRVVEGITIGKAMINAKYPTPAKLMTLESPDGTQARIVVNTVLQKELDEAYPGDSYVGAWFRLTKFRKKSQKQYNTFEIIEIEPPTRATQAPDQAAT